MSSYGQLLKENFRLNNIPDRIDRDEERELFVRLKQGDSRAHERLILTHLYVVALVASRYQTYLPGTDEYKEIMQIGAITISKALHNYDPQSGYRISTFLAKAVTHDIIKHYQRESRHKLHTVPMGDTDYACNDYLASIYRNMSSGKLLQIILVQAVEFEDEALAIELYANGIPFTQFAKVAGRGNRKYWRQTFERGARRLQNDDWACCAIELLAGDS